MFVNLITVVQYFITKTHQFIYLSCMVHFQEIKSETSGMYRYKRDV